MGLRSACQPLLLVLCPVELVRFLPLSCYYSRIDLVQTHSSRRISAQVRSSVWRSTQAHFCRDRIAYPCHPLPARCCVPSSATVCRPSGSGRPKLQVMQRFRMSVDAERRSRDALPEQSKGHSGKSVHNARNDHRLAYADEGQPRGISENP